MTSRRKIREFRAQIKQGLARDPLQDPGRSDIVDIVQTAASARLGRTPALIGVGGWTDSAIFNALGIPSVLFGHIGDGFHSATEWARHRERRGADRYPRRCCSPVLCLSLWPSDRTQRKTVPGPDLPFAALHKSGSYRR